MDGRRGFSAVTDNVARREAFERDHPGITISHTDEPWLWTANGATTAANTRSSGLNSGNCWTSSM